MLLRAGSALVTCVLFIALALAGVLTGLIPVPPHYNPFAPLEIRAPLTFVTPLKLWRADRDAALCQSALRLAGIAFRPRPDVRPANGCALVNTGLIDAFGHARLSPASVQMTCAMALRLALFDEHVLQNAARDQFGTGVTEIRHFGAYACRNVNNKTKGRLSKHATANALDIAGFTLSDKRAVSLVSGWAKDDGSGAFLRQVRDGACRLFSAVLGPDYNAAHRNHFHVDVGFYGVCR